MKRRGTVLASRISVLLRLVAALASVLFALDHGLASLHHAFTAHEVCAEHGELVHADAGHEEARERSSAPTFESVAGVEAAHHHCTSVPAAPLRAPVASAHVVELAGCFVSAGATRPFEGALPTSRILAFAPKLSPPA